MPLMPEDVHNVAFTTPPIGKRGYDEEDVDAFLTEVEGELDRLREMNRRLREQATGGGSAGEQIRDLKARLQQLRGDQAQVEREIDDLRQQLEEARSSQARAQAGSVGDKVAAVLQMARRTADDHVLDARGEASEMVAAAEARAVELLEESRRKATEDMVLAERKHRSKIAEIESERLELQQSINDLTGFGHDYHELLLADVLKRVPELGNLLMPQEPRPFTLPG